MKRLIKEFKAARRAVVPLLLVASPDIPNARMQLAAALGNGEKPVPKLWWTPLDGPRPLGPQAEAGAQALASCCQAAGVEPEMLLTPAVWLKAARHLPERTVVFMEGLRSACANPAVTVGLRELREMYKRNHRMLVLLEPDAQLGPELRRDFVILEEALPDDEALLALATELRDMPRFKAKPAEGELIRARDAVRGLSEFEAEQALAMSAEASGYDLSALWDRKRTVIGQQRGIALTYGGETFESIAGLRAVTEFLSAIQAGQHGARAVVVLEEIDKVFAAMSSDSSGVTQDQAQAVLNWMEEGVDKALLAIGPPGTGKSALARTVAGQFGLPQLRVDFGAFKGSHVGESENAVRQALQLVDAVAGRFGCLVIGTCNRIGTLTPELRRRFRLGRWFFDLPDRKDKTAAWRIQMAAYGVGNGGDLPADDGWSFANIRDCCEIAQLTGSTLTNAARNVVSARQEDPDGLEQLRRSATGRWLCAARGGPYTAPLDEAAAEADGPATKRSRRAVS